VSYNRENTVWQSRDGSWNVGFYDYVSTGSYDDEDFDPEWDVEYLDNFSWVSADHPTQESASNAWDGANPGGSSIIPYSEETSRIIISLDDKAAQTYEATKNPELHGMASSRPAYKGPPKGRNIFLLARDMYRAKLEAASHKIGGYSNQPDARIISWQKRVDEFAANTDERGLANLEKERKKYTEGLSILIQQREETLSMNRRYGRGIRASDREALNEIRGELESLTAPLELKYQSKLGKESEENNTARTEVARGQQSLGSTAGKYHINPKTGRANKCQASKRPCPFGDAGSHYDTKEAARSSYEQKMKKRTFSAQRKEFKSK
jgi:hypothetical protein